MPLAGAELTLGVFFKPDVPLVGCVGELVLRNAAINGGAVQNPVKFGARGVLGATWGEGGTLRLPKASPPNSMTKEPRPPTWGRQKGSG